MSKHIQAIRGMNDIFSDASDVWQSIETSLNQCAKQFAFQEIRFPIIEKTELFKRTIGEVTDIIEKEMYTFEDRNGDSLSLRPEGTAGCVRAGIEHGLFYNQTQKLYYHGPFYRHERPQKGRYRQFHQFGAEVFGIASPDADAELIALSHHIMHALGIQDQVTLELNSMGSAECRAAYRDILIEYFTQHESSLDEDSKRRLHRNPLRILDSKNQDLAQLIQEAPKLIDHLDSESQEHFEQVKSHLDSLGIVYQVNPLIVRGLDYYNRSVFEWTTDQLGAQNTICAGGRYDSLVAQLGGHDTPAVGFALGIERAIALAEIACTLPEPQHPDIFIIVSGELAQTKAQAIAQNIRHNLPHLCIYLHCGNNSFKSQLKRADKSNATYALIIGDDEINNEQLTLKSLRNDEPQKSLPIEAIIQHFKGRDAS